MSYVAVFGSHARGEERDDSDLDLLVRFSEPVTFIDLVSIEGQLSEKLNKKVDLVTEGALSKYIKPQIMKDLTVLYEE